MIRLRIWAVMAACVLASCTDADTSPPAPEALLTDGVIAVAPPDQVPACVSSLKNAGTSSLCASCACGRCPEPANACAGDAKCLAAVACEHENSCRGKDCYCGTGLSPAICLIAPLGPCRTQFEAAAGVRGWSRVRSMLESNNASNPLVRADRVAACTLADACATQCGSDGESCTFEDEACQERYCEYDAAREQTRESSAASMPTPVIRELWVNGTRAWTTGSPTAPTLRPRDRIALVGSGFGRGTDIDFAKIMIGRSRVLETSLRMFEQKLDIFSETNYETPTVHSTWPTDLISWTDARVEFYVPGTVSAGPLRMQLQKRIGRNRSLLRLGEAHSVVDAQTLRITDLDFPFTCDVVSELSLPVAANEIPVNVVNGEFTALANHGREIFWSYDFNIGLAHVYRGLDWNAIFGGTARDPISGAIADPVRLFGAIRTVRGEVPDVAIDDVYFDPYPQRNPIPGLLAIGKQFERGNTRGTGWVGYRYAESNHPFRGRGEWIGFNCASCHGYRIEYDRGASHIARVFPGLPNPSWSMKWTMLGDFEGTHGEEPGPRWAPGDAEIDKAFILYGMPPGAGEHTLVRMHEDGSTTANDYEFSPIAIPNVTNHMPIRRALSHTESYVGFEGSYIHSQEPDGALGSMNANDLRALTAYMTTLADNDDDLRNIGLSRHLRATGQNGLANNASEGTFVQNGWRSFPALTARVQAGQQTFAARCGSCHTDTLGANTNERMIRLDQVGRFFAPTIYQREMQSIRVSFLRDLYFTQHRGLLSDGHVRNLADLVDPDRCTEGTALYNRYYTVHAPTPNMPSPGPDFPALAPEQSPRGDVFRVLRATGTDATSVQRNLFVTRHRYFTTRAEDPTHFYWDYQRMRREYGPEELGTARPIGMPAAPHPWCAGSRAEVNDLLLYLLTL